MTRRVLCGLVLACLLATPASAALVRSPGTSDAQSLKASSGITLDAQYIWTCTYGYNARSKISSQKYMLTAGHCENKTWRHNGVTIGTTDLNNLLTSGVSYGDFQRVPASLTTPRNLIYASGADMGRSITSVRSYPNQVEGDYVCAAGITNNYRCGFIVSDDYYYGIVFRGQNKYMWGKLAGSTSDPLRSDPGDSGGPVFINRVALGITSAVPNTYQTAYTTMDNAEIALGVLICRNSSCT